MRGAKLNFCDLRGANLSGALLSDANLTGAKLDGANLENAVIQISDGKLKFANVKQTSPLTYGLVEEALNDCIESEEAVKNIIKHIKSKRQTSFKYDIKRSYS